MSRAHHERKGPLSFRGVLLQASHVCLCAGDNRYYMGPLAPLAVYTDGWASSGAYDCVPSSDYISISAPLSIE